MKRLLTLSIALALFHAAAAGATYRIQNKSLSAAYDSTSNRFFLVDRAARNTVIPGGQLRDIPVSGVQVRTVQDATFGKGREIRVAYKDGSFSTLRLYPELPFLLIGTELHNPKAEEADLNRVVPVKFVVNLGKPAGELRTLGTAGLTAPDKNPGSYLFLTLADPGTRYGMVAGWLTEDRGSGVLFSAVQDGKVEIRGQIDYGHLRIAPGASASLETLAIGVFEDARIGQELYAEAVGAILSHQTSSTGCGLLHLVFSTTRRRGR